MASRTSRIPVSALLLGLGGLIPFFASAAMLVLSSLISSWVQPLFSDSSTTAAMTGSVVRDWGIQALGAYGAIILSFLGGVRWGNLLQDPEALQRLGPLAMSVVPSLIAWPALLMPAQAMLLILAGGFIFQYVSDWQAVRNHVLPAWFGRLRLLLTAGAVLSLLTGWLTL